MLGPEAIERESHHLNCGDNTTFLNKSLQEQLIGWKESHSFMGSKEEPREDMINSTWGVEKG